MTDFSGKVFFAIGTGRCGTKFLHEVFKNESNVASSHERDPIPDTFQRFCKWYDLPVDNLGFLMNKERGITEDLLGFDVSFESSAYLSFSVLELYNHFQAGFILMVRSPERVVESYLSKGWYMDDIVIDDPDKIPSYQKSNYFHHFLGRTLPKGSDYEEWNSWTRVGKLSWYWNTLNKEVVKQFERIPIDHFHIQKLEELNFESFVHLTENFIKQDVSLSKKEFDKIASSKPNSLTKAHAISKWNDIEKSEFLMNTREMREFLKYSAPW